jgi:hypothetical protein
MCDRPDDRHARGLRVGMLALALLLVVGGPWIEGVSAQEPSIGDRMGDFFKRFIPGGGDQQPQPSQPPDAQPPAGQPPAAQAPAGPAPAAQGPQRQVPAAQAPQGQAPAAQAPQGQAPAAQAEPTPPRPAVRRADPSITDRVGDFFKRLMPGRSDEPAEALPAGRTTAGVNQEEEFDCPAVDIREGASTLMVQGPGEAHALSLRYQASFVRAARECIVKGKDVTIKVGVQGRIILGPAGSAGQLTIPLRYALVHEELGRSRMIWSKLYVVPVDIPTQQPNVPFAHVEEDMTVPIPKASELENYIVYIGFDPNGVPEKKAPPPKTKPKKP